jgi:acyl-CoA synthetase (AMP-forming)/AMP-acid ligase II
MISVTELVQHRATTYGDRLAFAFLKNGEVEAVKLSYAEIDFQSRLVAAALQEISTPGDRVLLMYPPGLDFVTGFLGCLYAGAIAVPAFSLNPARMDRLMLRLLSIAKSADTRIVLTTSDQAGKLDSNMSDIELFRSATVLLTDMIDPATADAWKPVATAKDTIALLQYTSGSTSEPRGVMVSHGNILHNLGFIQEREANNTDSISVTWLPSFHDMGLLEGILSPIYGVYPQHLMSPLAFIQRPLRWLKAISKYRATISGGPNFAYEYCVQSINDQQVAELDLGSWKVAYNGSEPVHAATMQEFAQKFGRCGFSYDAFCPVYGLAESTALTAATRCGTGPSQEAIKKSQTLAVACGNRDPDSRILIVDPDSCVECENGKEGEIWLAGPSVASGYWNDAESSERVFNALLADSCEGPFLRTGDLGCLIDDKLYITGRIKDLIILRGRKLFPQDIEYSSCQAHNLIRNHGVAAFSINADKTEQLVLLVELDTRQLKREADGAGAEKIPCTTDYKSIALDIVEAVSRDHEARVSTILLVATGQLERTSSGKIRRFLCRQHFLANDIDPLFRWDIVAATQARGSASG